MKTWDDGGRLKRSVPSKSNKPPWIPFGENKSATDLAHDAVQGDDTFS